MRMTWKTLSGIGWLSCFLLLPGSEISAQAGSSVELVGRPANVEIQGEPLIDALRLLQAGSGVPIAFSPELIPSRRVTRCDCLESTVGEALEILLEDTELTFVERRSQILVTPTSIESGAAPVTNSVVGVVRE